VEWIAAFLVLFGLRWLLRRWFWRKWLAGDFSVNRAAIVLTLLTTPGLVLVAGLWLWLCGEPAPVFLLALSVPLLFGGFLVGRWFLTSFAPAPGSGRIDAPSLLEESVLQRIHRDPD
jgi:hypothetical protein